MDLDHERLDVYHLALDFLVFASEIIEGLPRGRRHLSGQVARASLSIVLNLAEGAGKHSKSECAVTSSPQCPSRAGERSHWLRRSPSSPRLCCPSRCQPKRRAARRSRRDRCPQTER